MDLSLDGGDRDCGFMEVFAQRWWFWVTRDSGLRLRLRRVGCGDDEKDNGATIFW